MSDFIKVAEVSDLAPGEKMLVEYEDEDIGLFNLDNEFYAISDICTHDDGPLVEGDLEGDWIVCPRHGARFNIKTGEYTLPAFAPVPRYQVKVQGNDILVSLTEVVTQALEVAETPALTTAPDPVTEVQAVEAASATQDEDQATESLDEHSAHIREALRAVMDPELHLDVVTLGLIRSVDGLTDPVEVKMLLTTPFCPYGPWLVSQVKEKAEEAAGAGKVVDVEVLPEVWHPEMMEDPTLLGFMPDMFE